MTEAERIELKQLVRTMYDFQAMRITTSGRLGIKADGTDMDGREDIDEEAYIDEKAYSEIEYVDKTMRISELKMKKKIKKLVEAEPLYQNFLANVAGCGIKMSAVIMTEFDIKRADTVSALWQYAGLNAGMVKGKKIIQLTKKTDRSQCIKTFKNKAGKECGIVKTDDLIRGDRFTKGYVAPHNDYLKMKLLGVLTTSMIRANGIKNAKGKKYAADFYYPYKERLHNEENAVNGTERKWKDESDAHIHRAALRYMIKMFIKDLYVAWRTLEGLPVRAPYQEEYLGHVHKKD